MLKNKKYIFISIPNGLVALSILRSGILKNICESKNNLFVYIISPLSSDVSFLKEFNSKENVKVIDLVPKRKSTNRLHSILNQLATENQISRNTNDAIKIVQKRKLLNSKSFFERLKILLFRFFGKLFLYEIYFFIESIFFSSTVYDKYFEKIKPDLVLLGAPGTSFGKEVGLIIASKKYNVKTMAIGMSWDHFSAKYKLIRSVDKLIVWNEIMKKAVLSKTTLQKDDIYVGGVPHFDFYTNQKNYLSREDFFQGIGLDNNKKLILIITEVSHVFNYYDQIIDTISDSINDGILSKECQILVRMHPYNDFNYIEKYKGISGIKVQWPYRQTIHKNNIHLQVDITKADQLHLINTIKHSDIIISTSSTISLEACICDTPIINIAYDGNDNNKLNYYESIKSHYVWPHYKKLLEFDAIELIKNSSDLISTCNKYLLNPELRKAQRKRVKELYVFENKELASEKYSKYILDFLKEE
jgi:hypothetical protein